MTITMTTTGKVRGADAGGIGVFKGIPFARSPFGPFRMAAPVPAEAWEGTRDATGFGPRPPQASVFAGMPTWSSADGLDCLTVNVWSPDSGGSGLPVMVWIYDGAYMTGSADLPEFDARLLAGEGVVVVSFNYRIGMEGFGQVDGAPPNRGLFDQVAALRWVQENIAAFGGDPGNVTLFGESAGAGSIACLMTMPSAAGLFRRAIAQSVPGLFLTPGLAARITEAVRKRLGGASPYESAPEDLITAASAVAAEEFTGAPERWGRLAFASIPFALVVDGEVLPSRPWLAVVRGAAGDIDLIVGFNKDEFNLFLASYDTTGSEMDGRLDAALAALAPPGAGAVYRAALPEASSRELYGRLMSDWLFRMPSALLADAHSGRTHAYELAWAPTLLGACHGLDVPLTFGTLDTPLASTMSGGAPEAETLSRQFRTAWTRFATTGDPGWPGYEPGTATTHVFDVEPSDVHDPEASSRALWSTTGITVIG
ncbi:carboxylesterase/lipase family protein [Streptosporangium sp. NPDC000396]|uniref:carboxylesterase/lipase family protein n=1 Tax=Streptosporangium sp. NPDC000396 TaxID=3366185 RepID=UPI0036A21480